MIPERAQEEVAELAGRGVVIRLIEVNGQCYAHTSITGIPVPAWEKAEHEILIPIPAVYDAADLDGFYIALPYRYDGGEHKRVNGNTIDALDRKWRQVSWHYPEGKAWRRGQDTLETHIVHCRGFFLQRGATNAP
jgi:hypothetical protein